MKLSAGIQNHIVNQAVNFDKLPWNRKDRNFALFWPIVLWCMEIYMFLTIITGAHTVRDNGLVETLAIKLSIGTFLLYMALRNYVFALIGIPLIMMAEDIIFFISTGEYSVLRLFIELLFILPIRVELYRRRNGLSQAYNLKKDIKIGIVLALIFPVLWGISLLWR